jgi:tetratricopeptide (TPR) repeat protein
MRGMQYLAYAYINVGRTKESLELFEEAYRLRKEKLGPDHLDTLESLFGITSAYANLARYTEVVPLREEAYRLMRAKFGQNHPHTLGVQHWLAMVYLQVGRLDDAISHGEQNVRLTKAVLGNTHPFTLRSMSLLGNVLSIRGRFDEALSLLEEAWRGSRTRNGADHHDTLGFLSSLANLYRRARQPEKAIQHYNEYLLGIGRAYKSDQPRLAKLQAQVGYAYLSSGLFTEAEKVLRTSLSILEKTEPDIWTTYQTQSMLGGALLGQKNYAEAEPLLLSGYEGMRRTTAILTTTRIRLTDVLEWLVQLYDARGMKDKADEWRKKLEQAKAEVKPPAQP